MDEHAQSPAPRPESSAAVPEVVTVRPWRDPVVEQLGFPVNSPYVEAVWLPILGPSATWALRRLGLWAGTHPDGCPVELRELAVELGLGTGLGRASPMVRTIGRLQWFGMAAWSRDDLLVRPTVAPVTERQLRRLPERVVATHHRMVAQRPIGTARSPENTPGRDAALTANTHVAGTAPGAGGDGVAPEPDGAGGDREPGAGPARPTPARAGLGSGHLDWARARRAGGPELAR
jgi:hypothetical protein